MNELQDLIDQAYKDAKAGHWEKLINEWKISTVLAKRCSRFQKNGSGWTFLHQAAYFGCEPACRLLIRLGVPVAALTHDKRTAADIAAQKGYNSLAELLRRANIGNDCLWDTPCDPDVLPSSNHWNEAKEVIATSEMFVAYGGGVVRISKGSRHFIDDMNRILVGWHGTYDPPSGMDGESMLTDSLR
jgi:hypothetical protein